jgi:hypothetical protein
VAANKTRSKGLKGLKTTPYTQYPVMGKLPQYIGELKVKSASLESSYATIRKPGDIFDTIIQGPFTVNQFVNGSTQINTTITLQTFWNVLGTLADSTATLAQNMDLEPHSTRAFNFIMANRNSLVGFIKDMASLIPGQSKQSINNTMVFHLIMAIVSVAIGVVAFVFLLVPRIRLVQSDREKILRLLLLMPKANVYDLVHRVYTTVDEEDEDEKKKKDEDDEEEEEEEEEDDDVDGGDSQEIAVIADRSVGIYAMFACGLAALTIPLIAHAIFRYADDQYNLTTVELLEDLTILYSDILVISWQLYAGILKCSTADAIFCYYPYYKAVDNFEKYVKEMEHAYNDAIIKMQGNADVIKIFTMPQCFSSPNGIPRCITEDSPYMPSNYVSKTHNGYSNLLQNVIRSSRRYASDVMAWYTKENYDGVKKAKDSADDFWFVYEATLAEGEAGINSAFRKAKEYLTKNLRNGIVAANICYAVGLGASVLVFFWVFGSVRKAIATETRYNRGVLYMVPHDVLRNTKAMIEYIETLHAGLSAS